MEACTSLIHIRRFPTRHPVASSGYIILNFCLDVYQNKKLDFCNIGFIYKINYENCDLEHQQPQMNKQTQNYLSVLDKFIKGQSKRLA